MHVDNLYQTLHVHTGIVDLDSLSRSWESLTKRDQSYVPPGMRVGCVFVLCFVLVSVFFCINLVFL